MVQLKTTARAVLDDLLPENIFAPFLSLVFGPRRRQCLPRRFPCATVTKIGRGDLADIVLDDPLVSRVHAVLEVTSEGRCHIRDAGSKNGLIVNGVKVQESVLSDGDVLRLGESLLVYRFANPELPETIVHETGLVAVSPPFVEVVEDLRTVARSRATVLLTGETGTGKERLAHFLHVESKRKGPSFP